jgi:integrase
MKVTSIERSPGVWRLRIETGRSAPTTEHPNGQRQFSYETIRGSRENAQRRRFELLDAYEKGSFTRPDKLTVAGYLGRPVGNPKGFSHWVAQRLALGKIGRSSAENYQIMLEAYVIQRLGATRLQKLQAGDIQSVYTLLVQKNGLALATVEQLHRILRAALRSARKARLIVVNPMEEVEAPRGNKPKPKALNAANMTKVIAACEGSWKWPIAIVAFGCGLRRGELLGLRRKDIDLPGGRLHVRGQLVEYHDGTNEWKTPKTDAGIRTVSLPPDIVVVLRDVLREALEARMRAGIGADGLEDAPVFTRDGVTPIRPGTLSQSFNELCDDIGFPHFTFHGARHTHATMLLQKVGKAGAKAVSQRLGHADVAVTLRVYQSVFEEDDRELAGLMGPIAGPRSANDS